MKRSCSFLAKSLLKPLFATVLGLCAFCAKADDSLTMADFVYTNKLMVAGYTNETALVNFPVLVRISTSLGDFQYSRMRSSKGGDLAFFAEDGTKLASEVDTWTTSGESLVWVKLPSMVQGTKFYMCYRLTDELAELDTMVENPNPWDDYVGVWHLKEDGGKSKAVIKNSTTNILLGITSSKGSPAKNDSGRIGAARRIATDTNNNPGYDSGITIKLTNEVDKAQVDGLASEFTASFWYQPCNATANYEYLISRKSSDGDDGWGLQFGGRTSGGPWNMIRIYGGESGANNNFAVASGATAGSGDSTYGMYIPEGATDKWQKMDCIWSNATYRIYVDGELVAAGALRGNKAANNATEHLSIGGGLAPGSGKGCRGFNGYMDEVRLRPGSVSSVWVKAEYDTVNNVSFVTLAPPDVTWANGESEMPGMSSVSSDSVVFAGTVENCGGFTTGGIQCKVWATSESEPENWTTITNGLVASDAFSVTVPGLTALTAYSYKLRATGDEVTGSDSVSGSFTTPAGFAVTWSSASDATGISEVGYAHVSIAGSVLALGGASACDIKYKIWPGAESEPDWTTLTNGLVASEAFNVTISGLSSSTTYNYALKAVGDHDEETTPVTGSFTTIAGLTVAWSSVTSATGLSQISYDNIAVSGTVSALGGATSCTIQGKFWTDAGAGSAVWTNIVENLVLNDDFNAYFTGLASGTTYSYQLRAVGNDGEETASISGSFTTLGEAGEEIGSEYTHFFSDGTNAFWVVNDFERYLQFTVTNYTESETLTNFPVLVDVRDTDKDTTGFDYNEFYHLNGKDMAFVDAKGHIIPHEIDTWNASGMSLIWVRLPEMTYGTTFTMCYRSPLVDPLPDVGNTFERYVGVWHMNETTDGVVDVKDSTTNNLVAETHAQSQAGVNVGQMIGGNCRRVAQSPGSSASFGRIIAFDHDDILRTGVGNVFTYSGWYKLAATPPKWGYLVSRKREDADKGWGIQLDETSTGKLRVWSGSTAKGKFQQFDVTGASATGWNYWTFIYDGSINGDGTTNRLFHAYLNGNELASTAGGFTLNYPVVNDESADYANLVIGGQQNGTGAFNGWVDEARYSKGARSASWIKAEYNSMLQKTTPFVAKGASVSRGEETLVPVVVWESGQGLPDTIIDVSYAYVQFAGKVTFCGTGADRCDIEYKIWADGEEEPAGWSILLAGVTPGTSFSIPVTGLKQDMPYNFRIRAENEVDGVRRQNREHSGSFRTHGNVSASGEIDGELLRIDNRFVHRYPAGGPYTFTTPDYVTSVEIMVVGGGGAGGYKIGGGGGGGGLYYNTSFPVQTNTAYSIQVGAGGIAPSNTTTPSDWGNGQYSYFALASDAEHPLILVPGGGGGGSYVNDEEIAKGAVGAAGGGGTYGFVGGEPTTDGIPADASPFGKQGGKGNEYLLNGSIGKVAAGGGGGAGREGLAATSDTWSAGGAGGVGVSCSMTGETLFYGAGGGGGYEYRTDDEYTNYTKPGAGGSGIGGDAADIRNGKRATAGVDNTGAGGGGGSMTRGAASEEIYWQGCDGGDGVVLIAYEVHGRDPVSEAPQISMTGCTYNPEAGTTGTGEATIEYRAFWAGLQTDKNDLYVIYSTASSNDVANADNVEWVHVESDTIGLGTTTFVPPEIGHTYWVRLVARKDANTFMFSDEIASFFVPAVVLKAASWDDSKSDGAKIEYTLLDRGETTHLYCYWSESREMLEGSELVSNNGVRMLDLGTNMHVYTAANLAQQGSGGGLYFYIPEEEGLEREANYYVRLAAGDERGNRVSFSEAILPFSTTDAPVVNLESASWANNLASLEFNVNCKHLDPGNTEIIVYYSTQRTEVDKANPVTSTNTVGVMIGYCSEFPVGTTTSAAIPLMSDVTTNYYIRLGLHQVVSNSYVAVSNIYVFADKTYTKQVSVSSPEHENTLTYFINAFARTGCYGDDPPQSFPYLTTVIGFDEGPGWDNRPSIVGELACGVNSAAVPGVYDIAQGTLEFSNPAAYRDYYTDDQGTVTNETYYYYDLSYIGAKYTVTNAAFSVRFPDLTNTYNGAAYSFDVTAITSHVALAGVRNNQPVTYQFRQLTDDWSDTLEIDHQDVGSYAVQFKASAPYHDDVYGVFKLVVVPKQLEGSFTAANLYYTGEPQQPNVTTNVTGLIETFTDVFGNVVTNTLTCEFRDEAGIWQSDVPSFTDPGEYKIYFRAMAPNHMTFITNCTINIPAWDYWVNLDGMEGYQTEINISDHSWLMRTTGEQGTHFADPVERKQNLDRVCDNGLKLWQNYVIDRTNLAQKLVATIMQHDHNSRVDANSFLIHFPNVVATRNTGLGVSFRLDRKLKGESEFTLGELSDKYDTNVPLVKPSDPTFDPTGLYVFNIVLTPTNSLYSGQSVLASCSTVGVLKVSSALTNVVAAVPWRSMSVISDDAPFVTASEIVNPNGCSVGDQVLAYNLNDDGDFTSWEFVGDGDWGDVATVSTRGLSESSATTTRIPRGSAFWLVRSDPANDFFLVGRYTGEGYDVDLEPAGGEGDMGYTLVANPTMHDVNLTNLVFVASDGVTPATPDVNDRITTMDVKGVETIYYRNASNTEWGRTLTTRVGRKTQRVWTPGGNIPAGTGFWYKRAGIGELKIKFDAEASPAGGGE